MRHSTTPCLPAHDARSLRIAQDRFVRPFASRLDDRAHDGIETNEFPLPVNILYTFSDEAARVGPPCRAWATRDANFEIRAPAAPSTPCHLVRLRRPCPSPTYHPPDQMPHLLFPAGPARPTRADHPIPLGAALLIVDLPALPEGFDLVEVAEANPWAVIAVLKPRWDGPLTAWRRHPPLREIIVLDCDEKEWEKTLRRELAASGPPDAMQLVSYIRRACPDPTFGRALLAELRGEVNPRRSARHSAFCNQGPLAASGWKALVTICRALSLPGYRHLSDAAAHFGIDPRSLRRKFHRVLGVDYRDARHGFGWKWAVEHTLRLHGYIAEERQLPMGFRQAWFRARPTRG